MTAVQLSPKAYWLWPRPGINAQNSYAGFRHDFDLKTLPSSAPFAVTADQNYKLWVNGKYVCRGPIRGHQANWYYDTVDLLPFLKKGKNWISVEVHNPGISFYSYTYRDRAGFLCYAKWDNGTEIASRSASWTIFRNTAYNSNTGRQSCQLGFQEELDLRCDDRAWITEEENYTIPPQPEWYTPTECPQGTLPWSRLSPRPTEMLEEKFIPAADLLAFGTGKCNISAPETPYQENNFIRDFAVKELPSINYSKTLPETVRDNDSVTFTLPAAESGTYAAVLLDTGRLAWLPGTAEMEAETGDSESVLDLAFLHYLPENRISFEAFPSRGSLVAPGARFHLRNGHNAFSSFQINGTRYTALILRGNTHPVKITFRWRSAVSPMNMSGSFRCSDPVLNDIYAISVHTQRCCSMDAFTDTPWREQSQWWGDARIQAKNTLYLTGDTRLLEQGIRSIAGQPGPEGLLFANAPTTACGPVLPDYCLTWIHTLYDLYFFTGKTDLFKEFKARAEQILAYFERQRGADGLIRYDNRFWLFEDWSPLPKENTPTFLNLLFYYTRIHYQKLLEAAGFTDEAEKMSAALAKDRTLLRSFYDPEQGLFAPEINEKGERSGVPSVHDQVLAILCDIAPEWNDSLLKKRVIPCLKGELTDEKIALPSSFWATYLMQAADKFNLIPETLDYLKRGWEPMLPAGTAWEHFVSADHVAWSVCHAWSGHPAYHLPELFFGVKQTAPDWKTLELTPRFQTDTASFTLPLPGGMLKCSWNGRSFHLELPAGTSAKLNLPNEVLELAGPAAIDKKV